MLWTKQKQKILRRASKNTQKNQKSLKIKKKNKKLNDPDNHSGVLTHLDQTSWNVKSSGP